VWHAGDLAHTDPLSVLHHLSNVDKHRFMHGIDSTAIDPGPAEVESARPLEVMEDWRHEGLVAPGQVVRRLKLRRRPGVQLVGVKIVFSHASTVRLDFVGLGRDCFALLHHVPNPNDAPPPEAAATPDLKIRASATSPAYPSPRLARTRKVGRFSHE
jgi:hypothetical protein